MRGVRWCSGRRDAMSTADGDRGSIFPRSTLVCIPSALREALVRACSAQRDAGLPTPVILTAADRGSGAQAGDQRLSVSNLPQEPASQSIMDDILDSVLLGPERLGFR